MYLQQRLNYWLVGNAIQINLASHISHPAQLCLCFVCEVNLCFYTAKPRSCYNAFFLTVYDEIYLKV